MPRFGIGPSVGFRQEVTCRGFVYFGREHTPLPTHRVNGFSGRGEGECLPLTPASRGGLSGDLGPPLGREPLGAQRPALGPAELAAGDALGVLAWLVAQRLGVLALGDRSYDVRNG